MYKRACVFIYMQVNLKSARLSVNDPVNWSELMSGQVMMHICECVYAFILCIIHFIEYLKIANN